jgi:DtxR family Mn-dependent transcriptional regulator
METWKKFDQTELTHSGIHHLLAIYELKQEKGYARSVDVAKYLNISRGSTSITLKKLREKGYLIEDENKFYSLSEAALAIVNTTLSSRRIFKKFFNEILQLPEDIAKEDSCKIEHLISFQTTQALIRFISYLLTDSPDKEHFKKGFREFSKNCDTVEACELCEVECFFKEMAMHNNEEEE